MDLSRVVAERVPGLRASASPPVLAACARDLWPRHLVGLQSGEHTARSASLVVWPERAEEVARLVDFARAEGVQLVPFGAGSGVCGGVLPDAGTIVVDSKRLTSLRIDSDAPIARAGAGLLGVTLEEALEERGFSAGHFPSSIVCSTVGGWVAARGAGQCSSRYGKIEDMVVGVECVLGSGDVVRMQRRRGAPDLVPLITGSEGTLGFLTEVSLRLHPTPERRRFAAYSLATIERGFDVLREIMQAGLRPAVLRLYDPLDSILLADTVEVRKKSRKSAGGSRSRMRAAAARFGLARPRALAGLIRAFEGNLLGGSTLIAIFEGEPDEVEIDADRSAQICARAGGRYLGEGPARAWYAHRYSVSFRQSLVFGMGAFSDTMEVSAPWSRLEELYDSVRRALSEHALVMAHLSHAYADGCSVYFTFSGLGASGGSALARYDAAWRAALRAVHDAGGTLSHHHGVGRSKAELLGLELGGGAALLAGLRRAWDPAGILNSGALDASSAPRRNAPPPRAAPISIDERSLLASLDTRLSLGSAQSLLGRRGLTLGLEPLADPSLSLADWIALGMLGSPDAWSDPVRTAVAGFSARVRDQSLTLAAAPRRATGPDLFALFAGARGAIGRVEQVTLPIRRVSAPVARSLPFNWDRDSALSAPEAAAFERVAATFQTG
ncbi:MAG TPA: FAD-binding oxidoreductase [Polyangiaceae bacterium]